MTPVFNVQLIIAGIELVANVVWYRSKAKLKGALARRGKNALRDSPQLPPEIMDVIIAHLAYDFPSLKACAATCFTWYNIAFPYLHHTLIFRDRSELTSRMNRSPLLPMHKLGLLPYVKKAQFNHARDWIFPAILDSRSMRYFRALVNL